MRFRAILNQDGGTLKNTDIDELSALIAKSFEENGHQVDIRPVTGPDLLEALENAFDDPDVEGVIAGGGDGTALRAPEPAEPAPSEPTAPRRRHRRSVHSEHHGRGLAGAVQPIGRALGIAAGSTN